MEYNKILDNRSDLEGQNWKMPQCTNCIHNKGRMCTYYKADRLKLPVDMFNCPKYEKKPRNKEEAMKLLQI